MFIRESSILTDKSGVVRDWQILMSDLDERLGVLYEAVLLPSDVPPHELPLRKARVPRVYNSRHPYALKHLPLTKIRDKEVEESVWT